MDGVGEIHRRGAGRQLEDLSLGRKDVHLIAGDLVAQRIEEFGGIGGFALPIHQLAQPVELGFLLASFRNLLSALLDVLLVAPVGGHAKFGTPVHLVRPDLHLKRTPSRADHRGVDRLVQVELRS